MSIGGMCDSGIWDQLLAGYYQDGVAGWLAI